MYKTRAFVSRFLEDSLYRNSAYLFVSNGIVAATGFLFWALAARSFSPHEVGLTSTLIATATFVGSASMLGLDQTLIHYLAKHSGKMREILNTVFTVAAASTIVVSIMGLFLVPMLVPDLAFIASSGFWIGTFIGLMLATTWNNLLTSAFIGFRLTHFVLLASLLFAGGRIGLVLLFAGDGLSGLVGSHIIAYAAGVVMGLLFLAVKKKYFPQPIMKQDVVKLMRGYSLQTYVSSFSASLPPLILPFFVITILGPSEAAYYNMAFLFAGLLSLVPMAISQSLFAEGVNEGESLPQFIRKAVKLIYVLITPVVILIITLGYQVLLVFGRAYAEHGYLLLVLFCIAALFKACSFPLIAILRILGDIKKIIISTVIYVVVITGGAYAALTSSRQIWMVGVSTLISEITLTLVYLIIVRKKWPQIVGSSINGDSR